LGRSEATCILGATLGRPYNALKHPRADLLGVVEGENDVGPLGAAEDPM
jgi:hypothetical protein